MSNIFDRSDFNVGQDLSFVIRSNSGQTWTADQLGHLTDVECDFDDHEISVKAMTNGGRPLHQTLPHGLTGKITFARFNGELSKMLINRQKNFYENGQLEKYTFQFQLRNRDGSIDTYSVRSVTISKGKLFGAKADKEIDQGFSFKGSEVIIT